MKAIPTIDAHHHIWRLKDLTWLSGPQVPRIFGPYEPIVRAIWSSRELVDRVALRNSPKHTSDRMFIARDTRNFNGITAEFSEYCQNAAPSCGSIKKTYDRF